MKQKAWYLLFLTALQAEREGLLEISECLMDRAVAEANKSGELNALLKEKAEKEK